MFDDLRNAFREAIENFNKELSREQVPETVDRLVRGMVDEIAEAKAQVGAIEAQLEKARAGAAHEKEQGETARRREELAKGIEDAETAELAAQFALKHEGHQKVLEQKGSALQAELEFLNKEVAQMMVQVKEARAKRATLAATAGRGGARGTLNEAEDLFSELDRMAEKIEGTQHDAAAAEAMGGLGLGDPDTHLGVDPDPPVDVDFDARLAELKRRMGEE